MRWALGLLTIVLALGVTAMPGSPAQAQKKAKGKVYLGEPRPIAQDTSVKYDYDIVYVRAPRFGDKEPSRWTQIAHPGLMDPGADLMLLHPDGSEEVLVKGGEGSVTDPYVSFDGAWVYYALFHKLPSRGHKFRNQGSDIYKIHIPTRKIVRLTDQTFTPNTGAGRWASGGRASGPGGNAFPYGVFNLGPCPLPGGKVMFTSNRNGFRPPRGYPTVTLQLFVMDDDGSNVECVGHLNVAGALHPTILKDGRIVFSSLESQSQHIDILWGIWNIYPDGRNWGPTISAFLLGGAPSAFHFQTQLSDESIVAVEYYNLNNNGFGTLYKVPAQPPEGYSPFGPGHVRDPRNPRFREGRQGVERFPFTPAGMQLLTPFAHGIDGPAAPREPGRGVRQGGSDPTAVGKFTHPSGAPDNHLLTVWSPGPVNQQYTYYPMLDGGIYLLKSGKITDSPGELLLIKNDPKYNEQWPRALVPYKRMFGVDEPRLLPWLPNDGSLSPHLPAGTPFGLIGTSSMYKRESYPNGVVPKGQVTARYSGGDPTGYRGLGTFNGDPHQSFNWFTQGAEAGVYDNKDIHAIRIVIEEPTTDRRNGFKSGRRFFSHGNERLRILGEIPVRKYGGGRQPIDPDGNPDTSFLAKIPADTAFTFQTLDKDGMVLNMAQTWHQLRPGEVRNDCGGCHAHSQKPTLFKYTAAARPDYKVFDLTRQTALLTCKANDESKQKWDEEDEVGLRFVPGIKNVEFCRDVRPILQRSCVPCHTGASAKPAGNLVLDDYKLRSLGNDSPKLPGDYFRLAADKWAKFGYKPLNNGGRQWAEMNASRYIRKFQSRRSLLVWKIYGQRTDGWSNDDFPTETVPGDPSTLQWKGKSVADKPRLRGLADLDFTGSIMPPKEAILGDYVGQDGKKIRVPPLRDEDRRTIVRWIDLGCPIDLDFDSTRPEQRGFGWMLDDCRPTLTVASPRGGSNRELTRILVGMHDYYTGLDLATFSVYADFAVDDAPAARNLSAKFKPTAEGVWELRLKNPITELKKGKLTVSVKDHQGNETRVDRTFSVAPPRAASARGDASQRR